MRIIIQEEKGKKRVLRFPTGLFCNRFAAMLLRRSLKKKGVTVTRKQTSHLLKVLKQYRRTHPEWELIDLRDKKGQRVQIKL